VNGALSGSPAPALWRTRAAKPGQIMAALDLGTNNCRLLIARQGAGGYQVIDAFSRIVRLGEGVSQSGRLSKEAMDRTIDALKICAAKMERRGVSLARAVATEACRRADNCGGFVDRARDEAGITLEIITSGEEADLAFKGCTPLLDRNMPQAIVFDIGGGSTELGWLRLKPGRPPHMVAWHSMPFGVVSLTEEFGAEAAAGDNPMAFYRRMVDKVADELDPFRRAIGAGRLISDGAVQMLGTSGTVTTLAGIQLGLPRYERSLVDGSYLGFSDVERISLDLARRDCRGRATLPCIGIERADLVLSGCAILSAICKLWPVGNLRVADRGVREGILMSLMTGTAPDAVYGEDIEMDGHNNRASGRDHTAPQAPELIQPLLVPATEF
jgi:exopolyphosphatase/guanosine-5'-triphosphate,3'-diphosphate pyrophosphatase